MKLHYNADAFSVAKVRKLKSVIAAVGAKVEDVLYKAGDDVAKVSFFNTLPLLETSEGTFFSSNTIMRYLASTHKQQLYGGDNNHQKSLIDQWLDITAVDFEPAISGILYFQQGKEINLASLQEDCNKFLAMVEKHLKNNKFLVGEGFTLADLSLASSVSVVFSVMLGDGPRRKYSNTLTWYKSVVAAHPECGPSDLPKEADEAFRSKKGKKEEK